jgi:Tat protein translocase TatC
MYASSVSYILKEAQIRVWWIVFCFFVTCATCYWLSEDLFFGLATPYLKISKTSFFICTQITESLNTYIIISLILGFFFCAPYILYQFWCFLIPSCTKEQRCALNKIIILSQVVFFFVLIITFIWIMPNIWLFLYKLSNTESGAQFFIIKLQPKIYDFSILTLRILLAASLCSQIPILIICSVQYNLISIQTLMRNRRVSTFISLLLAALITPPDVWCQLSAWFCMLFLRQ